MKTSKTSDAKAPHKYRTGDRLLLRATVTSEWKSTWPFYTLDFGERDTLRRSYYRVSFSQPTLDACCETVQRRSFSRGDRVRQSWLDDDSPAGEVVAVDRDVLWVRFGSDSSMETHVTLAVDEVVPAP